MEKHVLTGASLVEYYVQEKAFLKNMHSVVHTIMQIDDDNRECDARHLLESTIFSEFFDKTIQKNSNFQLIIIMRMLRHSFQ